MEFLSQGPLFLGSLVFMLGIVVVVHELGHYLAGRFYGAAAESFSVGFGKPIFEVKDKRNTRWRVNWIPLGGFVKFVGESQLAGDVGKMEAGPVGKAFPELGVGPRSVIAVAGPLANFLLAAVIFSLMLFFNGSVREEISVSAVTDGSPAAAAGFETGDVIQTVKGEPVESRSDFLPVVQLGAGEEIAVEVVRNGETIPLTVTPERVTRENAIGQVTSMGNIGIGMAVTRLEPERFGFVDSVVGGIVETGQTLDTTVWMIGRMVTGKEPLSSLTGPVGIGDTTRRVYNGAMEATHVPLSQRLNYLFWTTLQICALVSVGIGFFNLLPLPVLDGGHLVFNAYEALMGKALPAKVQEASLTAGLMLLIGMFVFVTWGDILETGIFKSAGG